MVTDPIGDLVVRLKNAGAVRKQSVAIPFSKLKKSVALALKKCGYVGEVEETGSGVNKMLVISLLYTADGTPKIKGAKRISKPGRRLYAGVKDVHPVRYGKGVLVLSTPRGILTDAEARKVRVGGETLFSMW